MKKRQLLDASKMKRKGLQVQDVIYEILADDLVGGKH